LLVFLSLAVGLSRRQSTVLVFTDADMIFLLKNKQKNIISASVNTRLVDSFLDNPRVNEKKNKQKNIISASVNTKTVDSLLDNKLTSKQKKGVD
jgi:hypothetical protein